MLKKHGLQISWNLEVIVKGINKKKKTRVIMFYVRSVFV